MDILKAAIDEAYQHQVKALYQVLSDNVYSAENDPAKLDDALSKFSAGLALADKVRAMALESSGIQAIP